MHYKIVNSDVLLRLISDIEALRAKGDTPFVRLTDKRDSRSLAQNRLMHLWFKEIAEHTGNGLIYESGRCKMAYFLPMLRHSDNEKAQFAVELFEFIYRSKGHEYTVEALGRGLIESTRHLSAELFKNALDEMRANEPYNLTDPAVYGWEI